LDIKSDLVIQGWLTVIEYWKADKEILSASSPLCYKQLWRGRGTSKHNCLVSYLLCWRRHVSATVGHLHVTKMYI